jgi:transcription-repair coupling factor (superfamily II helicase)
MASKKTPLSFAPHLSSLIPTPHERITLTQAPGSFAPFFLTDLLRAHPERPLLFIASNDEQLELTFETLRSIAPHARLLKFPAWDCLPYDRLSPRMEIMAERMDTLASLIHYTPSSQALCVLTTPAALLQRVPPRAQIAPLNLSYKPGDTFNIASLSPYLISHGYSRVDTVREPGEYAIRGSLVDIFPSGSETPIRIDLFGSEIESIKSFDSLTQRSQNPLESFTLRPAGEIVLSREAIALFCHNYQKTFGALAEKDPLYTAVREGRRYPGMEQWLPLFYETLETFTDYLLPNTAIVLDHTAEQACGARWEQINDHYQARVEFAALDAKSAGTPYRPLPPTALYVALDDCHKTLTSFPLIGLSPYARPEDQGSPQIMINANVGPLPALSSPLSPASPFEALRPPIETWRAQGKRIIIACYSKGSCERMRHLLEEHDIRNLTSFEDWGQIAHLAPPALALSVLPLEHGFTLDDWVFLTEQDILGERLLRPSKRRAKADLFIREASSLQTGDLVVHVEHGVGRYLGLQLVRVDRIEHDCLTIAYEGGDKLMVPVENIDVLSRFGSDDSDAALDRLGSVAWQARKARVKERIKDIADALIKLAAERQLHVAEEFSPPSGFYDEFSARFPYPETDDQLRAIEDVTNDLGSGRAMDRLVCGDVGFGKTEVALRAAFIVAASGKQVAVIVPTTLLARQHYQTFAKRFQSFGLRVEQLSRLVRPAEAQQIREAVQKGEVNVLIGTQTLLASSLHFKDLGLMIVDEEQHFGVAQKEKLKHLKSDVHVLTLTATPIPRTLQMALSGVRDMSLITTPPIDRLAVRTYVLPFDNVAIREAILREHYRGGQTFYVCPRIDHLKDVEAQLKILVPEIKWVVAHGQMLSRHLETVMTDFCDGKYDVLLSTNIIESGIDIPTANTLIVHRADMLGLSQLYQLRGRVGRAKVRAYAYLTLPPNQAITPTAQKRLEVMQTLDSLGAGFQLASHDMDIRGAGNLLGEEQSGHIREVGVELYQQMLEDAIAMARTAPRDGSMVAPVEEQSWSPQIHLGLSILIPEIYVSSLSVRLGLYQRLGSLTTPEDIDAFAVELIDRFGPLPEEVENLLESVALKQLCRRAHIEKIDAGEKGLVISFYQGTFPNPAGLVHYIQQQKGAAKVRPDQKLVFIRLWRDMLQRRRGVKQILEELVSLAGKVG